MNKKYLIGIDAGTTSIKAVLFDCDGMELNSNAVSNNVYSDGIISEQNMNELWENVQVCLKELIQKSNIDNNNIIGIGVSGQGEGLWAIDENGRPIGNSILWNDGRAIDIINEIKKDYDFYKDIKKILASYIRPGSTITLIKWLKENKLQDYKRTKYFFACKDWIRFKLTGEMYWELSDASCSCLDIEKNEFPINIFKRLDIEDALSKFPPLIGATDKAGEIQKDAAEFTGLKEGTPVSGGMIDIVSTAAGVGAVEENSVCIILGTTGMTFTVLPVYKPDYDYNGWETHIDGKSYIKGMGTMAATPNLDWGIKMFFDENTNKDIFEDINNKLCNMRPFESGLLYLPHISNSGERAPFFEPNASAQIMGITVNTTKYDVIHSIMEGVALSIKDCLRTVDVMGKVYLTGGGAKSIIWAQIISNCINKDILISESKELSAKGAAISAELMIDKLNNMINIDRNFNRIKVSVRPNEDYVRKYEEIYSMYKKVQSDAKKFWDWRAGRKIKGGVF